MVLYVVLLFIFLPPLLPGFLVPAVGSGVSLPARHTGHCVIVLLEGLEKAASLTGLLGDLCHSLDSRSAASSLVLNTGMAADRACSTDTDSVVKHTHIRSGVSYIGGGNFYVKRLVPLLFEIWYKEAQKSS